MIFDKTKPHGTIWGGIFHGRLFQLGHLFDHEGNHLGEASELGGNDEQVVGQATAPAAPAPDHVEAIAVAQAQASARSSLMMKAVVLLEQAQEKVIAELQDVGDDLLDVIHEIESAAKQRTAVLSAILQAKGARAMEAQQNAAANGLTAAQAGIAGDQISAQLNA